MEREPAAQCSIIDSKILNVCLHPEQSFKLLEKLDGEGRESATRSCSQYKEKPCRSGVLQWTASE